MALRLQAAVAAHEDQAWCVDWSPCGKYLASCSTDLTVKVWEVEHNASKRRKGEKAPPVGEEEGQGGGATAAAASSPTLPLSQSPAVAVVSAQPVTQLSLLQTLGEVHTRTVRCCAFSPCGNFIASCRFDNAFAVAIITMCLIKSTRA